MQKATRVINHHIAEPWWGLRRNVTPCFGARLVQEDITCPATAVRITSCQSS